MTRSGAGPVRALVVGAGPMGRWHAHEAVRVGGVLAGFVDPERGRAEALALDHPQAEAFPTLSKALAARPSDIVHICTPTLTHDELILEALEGGCHVLAEKPVTERAEGTARLLAEAGRRELLLTPTHQFPFQRGVRDLVAAASNFGPIRRLVGDICSAGADAADGGLRDRIAGEILPHFFSMLHVFLSSPLADLEWSLIRPTPGEWLLGSEAEGTAISLMISMGGRPPRNTWEVTGEGGTGYADLFHGFSIVEKGVASRSQKLIRPFALSCATLAAGSANLARRALRRQPAYPGLRELVAEVYDAIGSGEPGPITDADTLDIARTRALILEMEPGFQPRRPPAPG